MLPTKGDHNFRALFARKDYDWAIDRMIICADTAEGGHVVYRMERVAFDPFGGEEPDECLMLPEREMRGLLQSVVDYAATVGISANGAQGTLRAKDENLADLRGIVKALLPGRA